jgi:hypothetical protein
VSLVGDALRKARREAAERDVERRGVLYSARISDAPGRSHLGLGLVLGALIAVVATTAGGLVAWWWLESRGGEPLAPGPDGPVAAVTTPLPGSDGSDTGSDSDSGSTSGGGSGPGQRQLTAAASAAGAAAATAPTAAPSAGFATGPVDPDPDAKGAASSPSEPGPVDPSRPSGSDPAAATDSGFAGIEDGAEVYILEADLGDVRLELDFIVFRADDPFAEINGIEVHLGGTVGGFRVKAIERDRVRLSDGRRTVVLRAP